jgi:hypothetical protein
MHQKHAVDIIVNTLKEGGGAGNLKYTIYICLVKKGFIPSLKKFNIFNC